VLELSKPIKNTYTSTFQQCIPSTSTTSSTLQFTVKQRANETPEQALERREANLRKNTRARAHETPQQAHERRKANLRNKA
jgi:Tfp pilus assembly protein PilV